MIHVIDDYYIDVDELNYTIKLDRHKQYIDTGKKVYDTKGYYGTLIDAIKGVRRLLVANALAGQDTELHGAIKTLTEIDARFEKILEKCMKGSTE